MFVWKCEGFYFLVVAIFKCVLSLCVYEGLSVSFPHCTALLRFELYFFGVCLWMLLFGCEAYVWGGCH